MDTRNKIKIQFEKSVENYLLMFKNTYFKNIECEDYWVDDTIGSVLFINDYFFSFDNIKYAIDNKVGNNELFEWYDHIMSHGMSNTDTEAPSLKEWWEGKNNTDKRLKLELSLYDKTVMNFTNPTFTSTKENPMQDGYYLVVYSTKSGIYQKAIEYKDGGWLKYTNEILHMIARTTEPIHLKALEPKKKAAKK